MTGIDQAILINSYQQSKSVCVCKFALRLCYIASKYLWYCSGADEDATVTKQML